MEDLMQQCQIARTVGFVALGIGTVVAIVLRSKHHPRWRNASFIGGLIYVISVITRAGMVWYGIQNIAQDSGGTPFVIVGIRNLIFP